MPNVLAIDIGGTKVALGIVDEGGGIRAPRREPTRVADGPTRIVERIVDMSRASIAEAGVAVDAVGVGCAGPLDPSRGVILSPPNLPGWDAVPLAALLRDALHVPVYVENDANAAGLGERRFGAARGCDDFVYVTVSTGVGGAAFVDGKLLHGKGGNAAEVGHMSVSHDGWHCPCGGRGCVEAFCSGPNIARRAREVAALEETAMVRIAGTIEDITAATVVQAVREGDEAAAAVWRDTVEVLGAGIANVINAYDPRLIVLGGGVSAAGALLVDPVGTIAKARALPVLSKDVVVVQSALGANVGVLGAAAVAFAALLGEAV